MTPSLNLQIDNYHYYLKNWTVDKILLQEGLGGHVVHDGVGQVVEDAVHGVSGLLTSDSQVFLQRSSYGWEDGLRCFI